MVKVIALCILLSACVLQMGGDFCAIESPRIYTSDQIARMDPQVRRDTLVHNEKGERLCGWEPSSGN